MTTFRVLLACLCFTLVTGCAPIKPWVKPYEREHLATRVMKWDRDPVSTAFMAALARTRECRIPHELQDSPLAIGLTDGLVEMPPANLGLYVCPSRVTIPLSVTHS